MNATPYLKALRLQERSVWRRSAEIMDVGGATSVRQAELHATREMIDGM